MNDVQTLDARKKNRREWLKQYRQRWRDSGNCIYCGIPCKPYRMCRVHRKQYAKYQKKHRGKVKMNTVEALREFKLGIEGELNKKTGWGRNDIVDMMNKQYQIMLERLIVMEESKYAKPPGQS